MCVAAMKFPGLSTVYMPTTLLQVFLFWNVLISPLTESKLVKVPQDTTVTEGERIRLECKTDLPLPVYWYHDGKEIFAGGAVSMRYKQFYNVTNDIPGEYNLAIESATQFHKGIYTCGDDEGAGEKRSAHVKVTEPIAVPYPTPTPIKPMSTASVTIEESEHIANGTNTAVIVVVIVVLVVVLVIITIAAILVVYYRRRRGQLQQNGKPSTAEDDLLPKQTSS